MARTTNVTPVEPEMHVWLRKTGKYHVRVNGVWQVIGPGDKFLAPEGKFTDNPRWEDFGSK